MHPYIAAQIQWLDWEETAQANKYNLSEQHTLKQLKSEGVAIHPIQIKRKYFGYADYPEVEFRIPFPVEQHQFYNGAAIECFTTGEAPVKGMLLQLDGKQGELQLFAPDFPDWLEDEGVGIKLTPDTRTTTLLKKQLQRIEQIPAVFTLIDNIYRKAIITTPTNTTLPKDLQWHHQQLNESQQAAIKAIVTNQHVTIVHGPPGTGKTTTLIEAILQLIAKGERIIVSAPSNAAVDHISIGLLERGVKVLRVGNTGKVHEKVYPYTPEGKLQQGQQQKELKQLHIQASQFRKMALQYKRNFGKAEREQRNLLLKEVQQIRLQIKQLQRYNEEKLYQEATVITGTPVGLLDANIPQVPYATLIIDEAGQCLAPMAFSLLPLARKWVFAGDHLQLPPTVISEQAAKAGLATSALELLVPCCNEVYLLNVQYRMRQRIAGFSSAYFYNNALQAASHLQASTALDFTFIDTAGTGFEETSGADGLSLMNIGELQVANAIIASLTNSLNDIAFISPYSAQVAAAKTHLPQGIRISTIDSFQGQEQRIVIISLVRSNADGVIGFLKDYRRMNVAITRAQQKVFIIGDSATIGNDAFFEAMLQYSEQYGTYKTAWEFDIF